MKSEKRKWIYDMILIALILLIGLSVLFAYNLTKTDGNFARVYVDNDIVGEYPLDKDAEYSIGDGKNVLCIEDGACYMKYAECPDKWCIKQGKCNMVGQRIVCLPNRVMIEICEVEK